jgi:hypothetical protein
MCGLAGARSYPTAALARVRARGVAGSTRPGTDAAFAELVKGKPQKTIRVLAVNSSLNLDSWILEDILRFQITRRNFVWREIQEEYNKAMDKGISAEIRILFLRSI